MVKKASNLPSIPPSIPQNVIVPVLLTRYY
nr:MAG TPA: hypothetical protein [Caudoviricetes sp.]